MMPRFLGRVVAICAVSAGVIAAPAAYAATAGGADADRPLGTLWYPGPYQPPAAAPVAAPPTEPPAGPLPSRAVEPAPAPVAHPAAAPRGAPRPDKPLGTLWYPGPYQPPAAAPVATPPTAPPAGPPPAPLPRRAVEPAPAAVAQPAPPPVGAPEPDKPLGTLWYPGPYGQGTVAGPAPVPAAASQPSPTPGAPPPVPGGDKARPDRDLPVHLSADEMMFDQEQGLVTASGNVEIIHGQRRLRADAVTYNQKTDIVAATGNVSLTEPGGERIFGDRMEVTGDLRDATIEAIGVILTDRSRLAAAGARRSGGTIIEMRRGVYSPCNLCKTDPTRPPLWQVKAVKIVHDADTKTIEYRDAWLEVFGVPVAYTPYFSHPDPTVKRKTGFLAPSIGHSSDLGSIVRIPYYFNISPHQDATVTALATSDEGSGAIGEYRHRFRNGTIDATGSLIGGDHEREIRGHIDAKGRFDLDDTWRLGFDINRATDDTYLRRYGFGSPESLNSRLFVEGFRRRNYFSANAYAFQGLQTTDDPGLEPLVLPMVDYNHVGETDRFGGETVLDVNLLAITRTGGSDTRRLSIRPGWRLPFIGPLGDAYKVSFSLNGDFYHVDELERSGKTKFTGASGRVVPQVMVDWRYPFVKSGATFNHVVEPIAVVAYSPNGGNSPNTPNEDSREIEFDDTNLFSPNKFTGIDRIEGGARVNYGIKWGVYGKGGGSTSFFIGQSYRPRSDDTFATGTGLEENFSDIVGRVKINPGRYMNLVYRTRFDVDNLSQRRNEVALTAGVPALNVSANYLFIESQRDSEFAGREEIVYSATSQLNRFWRIAFSGVNDLVANETRAIGAQLVFENECLVLTTDARRTFYEDRDVKPSDQITFRVVLKTLGEVRTGISP